MATLDTEKLQSFIHRTWDESIFQTLCKYISIPNVSPLYSQTWKSDGLQEQALQLIVEWIKTQNVHGLRMEVLHAPERTPCLFIEIDGTHKQAETALLYAHLDKQPPLTELWDAQLGPYSPVLKDGKLYGRGGADDGYGTFAAITAVKALQEQKIPHGRCVVLVEMCEESGSVDLPYYLERLTSRIGQPSLVVCLDSGAGNYDQLWLTSSLRGMSMITLKVKLLQEGVHSGMGSGIVPSTFRIIRQLLNRIEDAETGKLVDALQTEIPEEHRSYAKRVAATIGDTVVSKFPWVPGAHAPKQPLDELLLNATWRPTLSYTGADGFPPTNAAGNVLRPETTMALSFRFAPNADAQKMASYIKQELERDPPYGAHVTAEIKKAQSGWAAPPLAPWLDKSLERASQAMWGAGSGYCVAGEGGSIPFMGMLGKLFPQTQFMIVGVLGPGSNAHSSNEFLHVDMCQKLIGSVAMTLADHCVAKQQ